MNVNRCTVSVSRNLDTLDAPENVHTACAGPLKGLLSVITELNAYNLRHSHDSDQPFAQFVSMYDKNL